MIIKLSEDCSIEATDGICFTLRMRVDPSEKAAKKGKDATHWKPIGYYSHLKEAMKAVLEKTCLFGEELVNQQQLVAHLDAIHASIDKTCEHAIGASASAKKKRTFKTEEKVKFFPAKSE